MSAKNEADIDSDEEEVPELQAQGEPEVAEPPAVTDLSNSEVVTKYQDAAKIAQLTLQQVILKVFGNFFSFHFLNFIFFVWTNSWFQAQKLSTFADSGTILLNRLLTIQQ